MKNNVKKVLDTFVNEPELDEEAQKKADEAKKNVILTEKSGLIERVDKIFVTEDGRQLLREQY